MTHCDLFCGAGGFRAGLAQAGFATLLAIDKDAHAVATYRHNNTGVPVVRADIKEVPGDVLVRVCPHPDLLTAGIPCEPFSSARSKPAKPEDARRTLFRDVVRLAGAIRPRFILLENVPRIRCASAASGRPVVDEVRSSLGEAGYANQLEAVLNAADFGVASRRRRWFLLASLDPGLALRAPVPTTAGKAVTVREALSGLPSIPCPTAEPYDGVPGWHVSAGIGLAMLARYTLVRPGRRVADLPDSLQPATAEAFRRRRILPPRPFRQRGYRLLWDRPAPTLTGHCADELIHPEANRPLTVRECARLQGFADGHDFLAPLARPHNSESQDAYALVGDSVCPPVARAWGEVIKELCHESV